MVTLTTGALGLYFSVVIFAMPCHATYCRSCPYRKDSAYIGNNPFELRFLTGLLNLTTACNGWRSLEECAMNCLLSNPLDESFYIGKQIAWALIYYVCDLPWGRNRALMGRNCWSRNVVVNHRNSTCTWTRDFESYSNKCDFYYDMRRCLGSIAKRECSIHEVTFLDTVWYGAVNLYVKRTHNCTTLPPLGWEIDLDGGYNDTLCDMLNGTCQEKGRTCQGVYAEGLCQMPSYRMCCVRKIEPVATRTCFAIYREKQGQVCGDITQVNYDDEDICRFFSDLFLCQTAVAHRYCTAEDERARVGLNVNDTIRRDDFKNHSCTLPGFERQEAGESAPAQPAEHGGDFSRYALTELADEEYVDFCDPRFCAVSTIREFIGHTPLDKRFLKGLRNLTRACRGWRLGVTCLLEFRQSCPRNAQFDGVITATANIYTFICNTTQTTQRQRVLEGLRCWNNNNTDIRRDNLCRFVQYETYRNKCTYLDTLRSCVFNALSIQCTVNEIELVDAFMYHAYRAYALAEYNCTLSRPPL